MKYKYCVFFLHVAEKCNILSFFFLPPKDSSKRMSKFDVLANHNVHVWCYFFMLYYIYIYIVSIKLFKVAPILTSSLHLHDDGNSDRRSNLQYKKIVIMKLEV